MSRTSLVLACLIISALSLLTGYTQGGDGATALAAGPPPTPPPQDMFALLNQINTKLDQLTQQSSQANPTLRWDTNNPSAARFTVLRTT